MSMHMYPQYWMEQKIVKISSNLQSRLKIGSYASPKELSDQSGSFKWLNEYKAAHQKPESKRDEFDGQTHQSAQANDFHHAAFEFEQHQCRTHGNECRTHIQRAIKTFGPQQVIAKK